jgi:succinate dehydrogenase hydrophobic anchor subunit
MDFIKNMDFNILVLILIFGFLVWQVINYKKIKLNKWISRLSSAIVIVLTLWVVYLAYLS